MPTVIDWKPTVDPSELLRQAREALAAGGAVVLPGDCGYLALWRPGAAVELPDAAILAWGPDGVAALGATVPTVARRLMIRAWPAPLVVEVPTMADLPAVNDGFARFRCPDHALFDVVIPAVAELGPVLVADAGASTVEAAIERVGNAASLAVNGGERPVAAPTVVRVTNPPASPACLEGAGSGWEVTRQGAFPAEEVERLAARIVLFVCTGNTCRSPMAESIAKKLLADRLGCSVDELPARGFWLLSAGVATYAGAPASAESVAVAEEFGATLREHASRPVNPQLLLAADDVLAMTRSHLHALERSFPGFGPPPRLLCGEDDLDDPIGASTEVYRECARTIQRHIERLIPEWVGT
jgi:protein-tyrosine phosphatase